MALHCPECGFVVTEGANYCQRCGAYVGAREDTRDDVTTATYVIDEQTGELRPVDVGDVAAATGALVGQSLGATAWPLVLGIAVPGCVAFCVWAATRRVRADRRSGSGRG